MPKRKRRARPNGNSFGLLQIGAICMFAAPLSYLLQQQFWPLGPLVTANLKGQAAGRAVASILIFVVGVGLVVAHFVRGRNRGDRD
jgi:uncharacterized membrane protein